MRNFLCAALLGLASLFTSYAQAQIPVAFDPCRPNSSTNGQNQTNSLNFTRLCANNLGSLGVLIRGASADTHEELIEIFEFNSIADINSTSIQTIGQRLSQLERYDDIAIEPSGGFIEVSLVEKPRISDAMFSGNSVFMSKDLNQFSTALIGQSADRETIMQQSQAVLKLYHNLGYFAATIEPRVRSTSSFEIANGLAIDLQIVERGVASVGYVRFSGNKTISDEELLSLINTDQFLTADQINPEIIAADQQLILEAYAAQNLGRTGIGARIVTLNQNGEELQPGESAVSIGLVFEINEAPGFEIGEINYVRETVDGEQIPISEDDLYGDSPRDQSQATLETEGELTAEQIDQRQDRGIDEKKPFTPEIVEQIVNDVAEAANAQSDKTLGVETKFEVDEDSGKVGITFVIFEVPKKRVISVEFAGNQQTSKRFLRRIFAISPGDDADAKDLQAGVQRLGSTSLFEDISISEGDALEGEIAVIVTVEEAKTGTQRLGASLSSRTGFSLSAGIQERNWLGYGLQAGLTATLGINDQDLTFFIEEPRLGRNRDIRVGADFIISKSEAQDYLNIKSNISASLTKTINETTTHSRAVALNLSTITDVGAEASALARAEEDELQSELSLTYSLNHSSIEAQDLPINGTAFSLRASGFISDTTDPYGQIALQGSRYWSLDKSSRAVLSLRGSVDAVESFSNTDLPQSVRISNPTVAVRGFEANGFAPRQTDGAVIGGSTAVGASLQLRYKLIKSKRFPVYTSLYLDAGTVFDEGKNFTIDSNGTAIDVLDSDSIRISTGVGIVFPTPAGAITLTYSTPQKYESFDLTEQFQFSFGTNL